MKISVVIPAFNEEENIAACLEALTFQTTTLPFEVIVVDNHSMDRTEQIAKSFAELLDICVVQEKQKGRGIARRTGFAFAVGDIILSTDADAIAPSGWINALVQPILSDENTVATTGIPEIIDCAPWRNAVFNAASFFLLHCNYLLYGHPGLSGFSFAIRKNIYEAAGGFDPLADAYEDLELAMRVRKRGRIQLITTPRMIFSGRRFRDGLLKGAWEYLHTYFSKFIGRKRRVLLRHVK